MGVSETATTAAETMSQLHDRAICFTCGTQFDFSLKDASPTCRMCDEPRQFVPPSGQSWTSHTKIGKSGYRNEIKQDEVAPNVWSIFTTPQYAIGQRAIFIQTPDGNILWDCISYLDQETIDFIRAHGGLKAIAISHPHFYTSHILWAETFQCPVFLASEDKEWLNIKDPKGWRRFVDQPTYEILDGATMVKLGGHFPGSSVLYYANAIYTGDTIGISLSGLSREHHNGQHQVFFFHYAFPNFVPLGPSAMLSMWKRLKPWDFTTLHSLFWGRHVREARCKELVLESMQRQARHQEHDNHPLMWEV